MDTTTTDTLVIGGGQAGLAAAHHLGRAGTASRILDASTSPAGSWPRYYDSLTLFSPARFSQLPGLRFPGDLDRYPHRDEVVDYLTRYASRLDADIRYQRRVTSLTQTANGLAARGDGFEVRAHRVIVASGSFDAPGGFNWSSQHVAVLVIVGGCSMLRRECASRVSSGDVC